jgi:hypothetical protein
MLAPDARFMRKPIVLGCVLACTYAVFVLSVPHRTPRTSGLETDLTMMYVNGAAAFDRALHGCELGRNECFLWPDIDPFSAHGIGYPLALWIAARPFTSPVPGWAYFTAARLLSVLSAMAIIILAIVWLGWFPGWVAALWLSASALFFQLSYSGSTDLFAAALVLWGAYCLARRRNFLGGLLLGLAFITRYEYLILLPFLALWTVWLGRARHRPVGPPPAGQRSARHRSDANGLRSLGILLVPVLGCLALNLLLVGPPASNRVNLAVHYLPEVQHHYQFDETMRKRYPDYWAILAADPGRTMSILFRGLGKTTADLAWVQVGPVLLAGALIVLYRRRYRTFWILSAALAAHYLFLSIVMRPTDGARLYIVEIVALTMAGSLSFGQARRWYLLALVPFLVVGFQHVARETGFQVRKNADPCLELRGRLEPDATILGVRPFVAYVAGTHWRYWSPRIGDLYRYCLENRIDYVQWTGQEQFHRREYAPQLRRSRAGRPEFTAVYRGKLGYLLRVNSP